MAFKLFVPTNALLLLQTVTLNPAPRIIQALVVS